MSPSTESRSPLSFDPTDNRYIVQILGTFFASRNVTAYLVGGVVRDTLLGRDVGDVDVAVEGDPPAVGDELGGLLGGHSITLDERRGIVRVVGVNGGRGPVIDVTPLRGGILADLSRRDFAIDAMARPLRYPGNTGVGDDLIDPYDGRHDLAAAVVRAISPEVFAEDPGRLMRAPRLAAQLGFTIDEETAGLIRRDAMLVTTVSPERVRDELMKLIEAPHVARSLRLLDDLGLLCQAIPELAETKGVGQPREHHWDVFGHSIEAVGQVESLLQDRAEKPGFPLDVAPTFDSMDEYFAESAGDGYSRLDLLKLAGLLHDVAKPATRSIEASGRIRFLGHHIEGATVARRLMGRLRFGRSAIGLVGRAVEHHLRPGQMSEKGKLPTTRAIYRYYRDLGDAAIDTLYLNLADYLAARGPDLEERDWSDYCRLIGHILRGGLAPRAVEAAPRLLDGNDIMASFTLSPGPRIGRLLELVVEAQASGEISTKEEALRLVGASLGKGDDSA